ncbi:hypothetical protein D3C77_371720 [compost metagenome]
MDARYRLLALVRPIFDENSLRAGSVHQAWFVPKQKIFAGADDSIPGERNRVLAWFSQPAAAGACQSAGTGTGRLRTGSRCGDDGGFRTQRRPTGR